MGRGALPVERAYRLSQSEELVRAVVLGLKWGAVDRERFGAAYRRYFLPRFAEPLCSLDREGWATVTPAGVRLTRAGHVRVDSLCRRFYLPRHRERERPAKRPLAGRVR